MQRDGAVGPGIFELMATVAADRDIDAQPPCSFDKPMRLVAELAREEQQTRTNVEFSFGHVHLSTPFDRIHKNRSRSESACTPLAMDTNWSGVGSAQQYQGSVKCGIAGREVIAGSDLRTASPSWSHCSAAAPQMSVNVSARERLSLSLALTRSCTWPASSSSRGSACFHG